MPKNLKQEHSPFEQVIRIVYRPSRMLFIILVAAHILAFVSILLAEIFLWTQCLLAVLVLVGLGKSCHDHVAEGRHGAKTELVLDANDTWHLIDQKQDATELTLLPAVFVHPVLIILRFADGQGKRYAFILTRDNLDADSLRRLRVRLRFRNTAEQI